MIEHDLRRHVSASREIPAWLERDADPEPSDGLRQYRRATTALYGVGCLGLAALIGALIGSALS